MGSKDEMTLKTMRRKISSLEQTIAQAKKDIILVKELHKAQKNDIKHRTDRIDSIFSYSPNLKGKKLGTITVDNIDMIIQENKLEARKLLKNKEAIKEDVKIHENRVKIDGPDYVSPEAEKIAKINLLITREKGEPAIPALTRKQELEQRKSNYKSASKDLDARLSVGYELQELKRELTSENKLSTQYRSLKRNLSENEKTLYKLNEEITIKSKEAPVNNKPSNKFS